MQTLANVLNKPIKIAASKQAPALGAAMYAATAVGIFNSLEEAIDAMGQGCLQTYFPNVEAVKTYEVLYQKYLSLGTYVEAQNI